MSTRTYDAVVIGGGAAGVGVAIALKDAGLDDYVVLERYRVGASFSAWPAETRFITPSFPTNSIGMLDLNSIAIGASPAFSLSVEHPTGLEYAHHLEQVARYTGIPVQERTQVLRVTPIGDEFVIDTDDDTIRARHVVWAAGEYQFPQLGGFPGSASCRHTVSIRSYAELDGDEFVVIGGYESGVDAAYHLASRGKRVVLFDAGRPWNAATSDPSVALSTYSLERMRETPFKDNVELMPHTRIVSVNMSDGVYEVSTEDDDVFRTPEAPILAVGFEGGHRLVKDLFRQRADGFPLLNERDESTLVPGLFLCGPSVRHDDHVFCFIYKYRQRFAVVAKAIATSLGLPAKKLEEYRSWGMYLDDLSCCGEECTC